MSEKSGKFLTDEKAVPTGKRLALGLGKLLLVLLETAALLLILLYGALLIVTKGPSLAAKKLFVMSVKETSAMGFLADWFLSPEEIAEITQVRLEEDIQTDTSLVRLPQETVSAESGQADAWGLVDEDGDGIIVERVTGSGYSGFMMIVQDPTRVIMGAVPESFGARGYTVAEMVEKFDAVAGINAGGFYDPNGTGNGSIPDSMVVFEGKAYYSGTRQGFVGLDSNAILHVGVSYEGRPGDHGHSVWGQLRPCAGCQRGIGASRGHGQRPESQNGHRPALRWGHSASGHRWPPGGQPGGDPSGPGGYYAEIRCGKRLQLRRRLLVTDVVRRRLHQ